MASSQLEVTVRSRCSSQHTHNATANCRGARAAARFVIKSASNLASHLPDWAAYKKRSGRAVGIAQVEVVSAHRISAPGGQNQSDQKERERREEKRRHSDGRRCRRRLLLTRQKAIRAAARLLLLLLLLFCLCAFPCVSRSGLVVASSGVARRRRRRTLV